MECKLGGLSQDRLEFLGIAFAGSSDHDPVNPLTRDAGLAGAQFVDAPADNLLGLLNCPRRFCGKRLRHEGQAKPLVVLGRDRHIAATGHASESRTDILTQLPGCSRDIGRISDPQNHRSPDHAQPGKGDPLFPQLAADILDHIGQAFGPQGVGVDFKQQVRAALQIQTEVQRLTRHEAGQIIAHGLWQNVRQRKQQAEHHRHSDENQLPA